jgi:hypothetical protein
MCMHTAYMQVLLFTCGVLPVYCLVKISLHISLGTCCGRLWCGDRLVARAADRDVHLGADLGADLASARAATEAAAVAAAAEVAAAA